MGLKGMDDHRCGDIAEDYDRRVGTQEIKKQLVLHK